MPPPGAPTARERDDSGRTELDPARTILESVTDAFFLLDREFRFRYLNGTAQRLLRRDDLVGKHLFTEFPGAVGTQFQTAYERAMHEGVRVEFVEHHPAPLDRWYEVRAYPSPEGISVYFRDITEQRQIEAVLERNRDQMELVVRGAEVGIWYCPLPFDELIWDAKVKEHFHLPPDARVTIETFYERLHPDDRERTRAAIDRSVAERSSYDIDYRTVSPDGSHTKWIRAMGRAFYDGAGAPIRFDGITVDVSQRKLAELVVRDREERYRLATRATNDVIWDWDLTLDRVLWNDALEVHFGHRLSERKSMSSFWTESIHPDDRQRVLRSIHHVIDDPLQEHWEDEYRFARADGTWADVLDRGYVLRDAAGKGLRMIGAMQDLTERKRVERERERVIEAERAARSEAERQSRLKDEFLATLSHELRTPLNAILGWSQILLRPSLPEEIRRGLETVARNARAQARIVDDLLDMSRMLVGKLDLDMQPVAIGTLVETAIDAARPAADAKDIKLIPQDSASGNPHVLADAGRLQQVLSNLLANAIKFTPSGGTVGVTLRATEREVEIVVRDDGEGIRADFLPFVFDRFRQADGSITRRHGGLGLGLSIVKQVVDVHGGAVTAESAGVGLGSSFTVRLPRLARTGTTERRQPDPSAIPDLEGVSIEGVRALVVDDEPDAARLAAQVLGDRGARATTAASAEEALDLLRTSSFDVLVCDIGMPGVDGFDLLRRVRASAPATRLPAIAMTAYARVEDRLRCLAAGFQLHLPKPIDAVELVTVVAAATGRLVP